jgi:hypothetical protein
VGGVVQQLPHDLPPDPRVRAALTSTSVGTPSWSRNRWSTGHRPGPPTSSASGASRVTSSHRRGATARRPGRRGGRSAPQGRREGAGQEQQAARQAQRPQERRRRQLGLGPQGNAAARRAQEQARRKLEMQRAVRWNSPARQAPTAPSPAKAARRARLLQARQRNRAAAEQRLRALQRDLESLRPRRPAPAPSAAAARRQSASFDLLAREAAARERREVERGRLKHDVL